MGEGRWASVGDTQSPVRKAKLTHNIFYNQEFIFARILLSYPKGKIPGDSFFNPDLLIPIFSIRILLTRNSFNPDFF